MGNKLLNQLGPIQGSRELIIDRRDYLTKRRRIDSNNSHALRLPTNLLPDFLGPQPIDGVITAVGLAFVPPLCRFIIDNAGPVLDRDEDGHGPGIPAESPIRNSRNFAPYLHPDPSA